MAPTERIAIDDNFSLVRDARRHVMTRRLVVLVAIALAAGAVVGAVVAESPVLLVAVPIAVVLYADLRSGVPKVADTAEIRVCEPYVEIGPMGLRLHHPVLDEDLIVGFSDIQAFDVHPTPARWSTAERQFALRRPDGTRHPLDEPPSFLGVPDGTGKEPVPLLSLDLHLWAPNVVLVLREPRRLRALTPPGGDRGRVPPRRPPRHNYSFGGAPSLLTGTWRTVTCTGLYLRVVDTGAVAAALASAGVRGHLNCHDWVRATGLPHPGLDAVPADF